MLDSQLEGTMSPTHIEVVVPPGMKISRPTEDQADLIRAGAGLAGMVDDEDGDVVLPLEITEIGKDARDLEGGVLVDSVETDERIEDEKNRTVERDRRREP